MEFLFRAAQRHFHKIAAEKLCPRCYGNGFTYWPIEGGMLKSRPCTTCRGTGVKEKKDD